MSRNGSGVYTLPATNPVVPGSTIATVWANGTMTDIAAALTASVAADGQTPMTGNLNANSNKIVGLAAGTVAGNSVEFAQFSTPTFTGNVTCSSTGYIKIPSGTTAERPASPVDGEIRFNTTTSVYEGFKTVAPQTTISGITNVTTTATATTVGNHGLQTGDNITITGCTPSAYNGSFTITVTGNTTFTYTMLSNPGGPTTVVGTYYSNVWFGFGGTAAGSNTQIQYNNNGVLGASSALTFDGVSLTTPKLVFAASNTPSLTNYQGGALTSSTAQASTSGTSIDFNSIPSWVKRITVMFNGVSTNGTSYVIVQLGDAGGVETTSYIGNSQQGGSPVAFSTGFLISTAADASAVRYGAISITLIGSNAWTVQGVIADTNNNWTTPLAGVKTLSATLDRVRITTVNGTDAFDAGSINIFYE